VPHIDLLAVNAVEAAQVAEAMARPLSDLPVPALLVSDGPNGATYYDLQSGTEHHQPSPRVDAVDTTGAGDVLIGYFSAGLDLGHESGGVLETAVHAAALHCTRLGTSDAIPGILEVKTFLSAQT